jgi:hypothetical protein
MILSEIDPSNYKKYPIHSFPVLHEMLEIFKEDKITSNTINLLKKVKKEILSSEDSSSFGFNYAFGFIEDIIAIYNAMSILPTIEELEELFLEIELVEMNAYPFKDLKPTQLELFEEEEVFNVKNLTSEWGFNDEF